MLSRTLKRAINTVRFGPALGRREVDLPVICVGSENYGQYALSPDLLGKSPVVYSCGVGEDVSFDLGIISQFGARVRAFDPTPRSVEWIKHQSLPAEFTFYPWAVGADDGRLCLHAPRNPSHVSHSLYPHQATSLETIDVPAFRLSSIMAKLQDLKIDVLKLDIEGAEYDVIDGIISERLNVKQILVEFHHRFSGIGRSRTKKAIRNLKENGYSILDVSQYGQIFTFVRVSAAD